MSVIGPVYLLGLQLWWLHEKRKLVCNTYGGCLEFNPNLMQTFLSLDKPGI